MRCFSVSCAASVDERAAGARDIYIIIWLYLRLSGYCTIGGCPDDPGPGAKVLFGGPTLHPPTAKVGGPPMTRQQDPARPTVAEQIGQMLLKMMFACGHQIKRCSAPENERKCEFYDCRSQKSPVFQITGRYRGSGHRACCFFVCRFCSVRPREI